MKHILDETKPHQRYFEEISAIPRGSYHEKRISDYLAAFARDHDFQYVQDSMGNVVIYKPAAKGYEDHPAVALQAHMDIVWEKDEGYEHDFLTDPVKLIVRDGILTAEHTTLGIDDGSGVAYILAVLDDETAKHPALQAIFTVQEEVGMYGAQALDKSLVTAERFISLDCGGGDQIYVSSLGGRNFEISFDLQKESTDRRQWQIIVSGLVGDYSSSYLSGAQNAIALMAELLQELDEEAGITLVSIEGGDPKGKVAAACTASFISEAPAEKIRTAWKQLTELLYKDCRIYEKGISLELTETKGQEALTGACSDRVLNLLAEIPCGAVQANSHDPKLIGLVINLMHISCESGKLCLKGGIRAESNRKLRAWTGRVKRMCKAHGIDLDLETGFPAWEYDPDSQMVQTLREVFHRVTGDQLGTEEVQGGLECSIFMEMDHPVDMVTMGPFGACVHTTKEYCDLRSYDRIYEVFLNYLAAL